MTPNLYRRLREAGVDLVTLGDHIYKKAEIISTMDKGEPHLQAGQLPPDAPGREFAVATARDGTSVAVLCVLGRTFMRSVDCPFHAADRVLTPLAGTDALHRRRCPRRGDSG